MILDEKIIKSMITEKYPNITDMVIVESNIFNPLTKNNWVSEVKFIMIKFIFRDISRSTTLDYNDYLNYRQKLRNMKLDSL